MPLSRRGRRRPHSTQQDFTPPYPPGQSPLEAAPVEIFNQIFCESGNLQFVQTSKTIYARLAYPSDSLVLDFFRCSDDGKRFSDSS